MAQQPVASSSGADDTAALRDLLQTCIPPRTREAVLGSDDAFAKLGLSRFRDAALALKGARLFGKLQTAAPPVLHEPPGPACDWQLATLPGAGASLPPAPPAAEKPHPNALAAAFTLPPGNHVLPEAAKGRPIPPKWGVP